MAAAGKPVQRWLSLLQQTRGMEMLRVLQDYPFTLRLFLAQTYGEETM